MIDTLTKRVLDVRMTSQDGVRNPVRVCLCALSRPKGSEATEAYGESHGVAMGVGIGVEDVAPGIGGC